MITEAAKCLGAWPLNMSNFCSIQAWYFLAATDLVLVGGKEDNFSFKI